MMLTGESNEPLEGCWGQNAEPTPSLQKKSQPFALCLAGGNAVLSPPVEKRSQLKLSAQWSCRGHWMEVGLQIHIRTVHGYCLFLRSYGSDQMSRADVHSIHQNTGRAVLSGCPGGAGALILLSIRKGENSRRFPATRPAVTTIAATTSSISVVLFCEVKSPVKR